MRPKCQRAYSWQNDNVEEYRNDLWALYEKIKVWGIDALAEHRDFLVGRAVKILSI